MKRRIARVQRTRKPATSSTASQKVGAEQALAKLVHEYAEALRKHDVDALDEMWTPDYTFINPPGELLTKAQRIANIKSGATAFQAMNLKREHLHVHGDFAVEVGRSAVCGEYNGRESDGEYSYTCVWIKLWRRWQMLATQITLIAQ